MIVKPNFFVLTGGGGTGKTDPQGQAVQGALGRLGLTGVTAVRQGKRFEVDLDGQLTDERLADVHRLAESLLSNPVIEDYVLRVEDEATA